MSQSFGGPGRKPGKPGGGPGGSSRGGSGRPSAGGQPPRQPREEAEPGPDGNLPNWAPSRGGQQNMPEMREPSAPREIIVPAERIEPKRRGVALIVDVLACYLVAMIVGSIPYVSRFLQIMTVWLILLLLRDFFFSGRGVGKNLMGLRVVDVTTGEPASMLQSFLRNIILLAPLIVVQLASLILVFIPIPYVNEWIMKLINIVGMVYVAIALPLESYRAYSRDDSLRIGDEVAGTAVIDAPMDFSEIVPRK